MWMMQYITVHVYSYLSCIVYNVVLVALYSNDYYEMSKGINLW